MTQVLVHPLVAQKNQNNLDQIKSDLLVQLDYLEEEILGRFINSTLSRDTYVSFLRGESKVKLIHMISKRNTLSIMVINDNQKKK